MPLWPFQNVVCHSEPYAASFIAPRCSAAYCLYLLALVALIVLPLYATFSSNNVWVKESAYIEQPVVEFRHEVLLVLSGNSLDDSVGWSTSGDLSPLLPAQVRVPLVRSGWTDDNHDGLPDVWTLSLQMPKVIEGVRHILLMAVYGFELRDRVREKMSGLVVVDIASPYLASGVWVQGELRLKQLLPLHVESEARDIYDQSPLSLNFTSNWASANQPISTRSLLQRYAVRNESVLFANGLPPSWDYSPQDYININLVLAVPPQQVRYVPSAWEMLKVAWMQVLSFIIPVWIALRSLKAFAYDNQLVDTYIVPNLPPLSEM